MLLVKNILFSLYFAKKKEIKLIFYLLLKTNIKSPQFKNERAIDQLMWVTTTTQLYSDA